MKKIKTSIALLLTILFTLSAFAAAPTSVSAKGIEKKAKLKLWVPDREVKTAKKLAKSFVKKYKSKKISVKVSAESEADAGTYLLSDNSSAADVASIASDQLNNFVNAKVISPIKSPKSIKKNMLKSLVSASTFNKKLYAIPRSLNGYCLVYDKTVVSEKQAKTLEGVLQACQSKNKKFIMDAGNGYYSCIFLFTGGLRLKGLKSDGFTQKFNKYDINTLTKTLKAFSVLFHKYSNVFRSLAVSNIPAGFTSTSTRKSTCGAGIDGIWDYEACKAALGKNFGAAKLPTINVNGKNKQIVSMLGYTGYVVNKASKYPKAAQALAKYISTKSAQKKRASKNIVPTNKKLLKSSYISKKPMMKALYKQSKYSVPLVSIGMIWDPFGNLGNKITAKNINPDKYDYKKLIEKTIDNILDM